MKGPIPYSETQQQPYLSVQICGWVDLVRRMSSNNPRSGNPSSEGPSAESEIAERMNFSRSALRYLNIAMRNFESAIGPAGLTSKPSL